MEAPFKRGNVSESVLISHYLKAGFIFVIYCPQLEAVYAMKAREGVDRSREEVYSGLQLSVTERH